MTENNSKTKKHPNVRYALSCFTATMENAQLHDRWLSTHDVVDYMNEKNNQINVDKPSVVRLLNKFFPDLSFMGNTMFYDDGSRAQLYRLPAGKCQELVYATKNPNRPIFPEAQDAIALQVQHSVGRLKTRNLSRSEKTTVERQTTRRRTPREDAAGTLAEIQNKKQRTAASSTPVDELISDDLVGGSSNTPNDSNELLTTENQRQSLFPIATAVDSASPPLPSSTAASGATGLVGGGSGVADSYELSMGSNHSQVAAVATVTPSPPPTQIPSPAAAFASISYWDSPEARKLFGVLPTESDARQAIDNQIEILCKANKSESGYLGIIGNLQELKEPEITPFQKWSIRQKAQYLCLSLNFAKQNMNTWKWERCCQEAVQQLKLSGITHAKNARTVSDWYRQFREARLLSVMVPRKKDLPAPLQAVPDHGTNVAQFETTNRGLYNPNLKI